MSSNGNIHGRFARAVQGRNLHEAELAARELGALSLRDALSLVLLYAMADHPRFERAAVRWLARLALERSSPLTLADGLLAAASLVALRTASREQAARTLLRLAGGAFPAATR
jgi:hypothetical protein